MSESTPTPDPTAAETTLLRDADLQRIIRHERYSELESNLARQLLTYRALGTPDDVRRLREDRDSFHDTLAEQQVINVEYGERIDWLKAALVAARDYVEAAKSCRMRSWQLDIKPLIDAALAAPPKASATATDLEDVRHPSGGWDNATATPGEEDNHAD